MPTMMKSRGRRGISGLAIAGVIAIVLASNLAFSDGIPRDRALANATEYVKKYTSDPVLQDLWIRHSMKIWEFHQDINNPDQRLKQRELWQAYRNEPKDAEEEKYVAAKATEALNSTPVDWERVYAALYVGELGFSNEEMVRVSENVVEQVAALKVDIMPPGAINAAGAAMTVLALTQDSEQVNRLVQATTPEFWGLAADSLCVPKTDAKRRLPEVAVHVLFDMQPLDLAEEALSRVAKLHRKEEETSPGTLERNLVRQINRRQGELAEMRHAG